MPPGSRASGAGATSHKLGRGKILNNSLKFGLLAVGLGLALNATNAQAVNTTHYFDGNSTNYCQAFYPSSSNGVRNRVLGIQNTSTTNQLVACAFHSTFGDANASYPTSLDVYFYNSTATAFTVTCTLMTGYQTNTPYVVAKTSASIAPGAQGGLSWDGSDNPVPGADFGNDLIGINCTLPPGAVINDTYLGWSQDNGV